MKKIIQFFIEWCRLFYIGIRTIITNKILYILSMIISLTMLCIIINPTFNYNLTFEDDQIDIPLKLSSTIKYYYQEPTNETNYFNSGGALSLIACLKENIPYEELNSTITEKIFKLEEIFNQSEYNFSFKYQDIFTGFSVSYNENQGMYGASMLKAPYIIYLYQLAQAGTINLEDKLTYTQDYYLSGTGILKSTEPGLDYTIRELSSYTIRNSDNIAYKMLATKYGLTDVETYWNQKGANLIFQDQKLFGAVNSHDAIIYMKELYNISLENTELSQELMNNFLNTTWKVIKGKNKDIPTYNKSGWGAEAFHDTAIVMTENPYILCILTKRGEVEYQEFINEVNSLIADLHEEYWKQKMNKCSQISQY